MASARSNFNYRGDVIKSNRPKKRSNTAAKEQEARFQAKLKKNKGNKVDATVVASGRNTTTKKKKARFGVGDEYVIDGKRNIDIKQLQQTKMTGPEYMREWKRTGKRPTKPLDGTHKDGSRAARNRSRYAIETGTAKTGPPKIPTKPRAGDYKDSRLFRQAQSKWNNKYGKLAEGRKDNRKRSKGTGNLNVKPVNRVTQRAKRMAQAILGPIASAVVPGSLIARVGIGRAAAPVTTEAAKRAATVTSQPLSRYNEAAKQVASKVKPKTKTKTKVKKKKNSGTRTSTSPNKYDKLRNMKKT